MRRPLVIGTSARPGSGQDTFAAELARRFEVGIHSMGDVLRKMAEARGLPASRDNLRALRRELTAKHGPGVVADSVVEQITGERAAIVTGIRTKAEYEVFQTSTDFRLVFVTADPAVRYRRVLRRGAARDPVNYEQFLIDMENANFDLDYLDSAAMFHLDCNMELDSFLAGFDRLTVGFSFMPELSAATVRRAIANDHAMTQTVTMMSESRLYSGRLFEVLDRTLRYDDTGRSSKISVESVRRPPGVRVILTDPSGNMLLMLREYRVEHSAWDIRLAGGKVFDSLADFQAAPVDSISLHASKAAVKETAEEAGVRIDEPILLHVSRLGASIEWDLYLYKAIVQGPAVDASAEVGEFLYPVWYGRDEVRSFCLDGRIREDRSALLLMRYLRAV